MMRERIADLKNEGSFAVDEHIWGHRLYDEQLPHLTFLEFLSVLESNAANPLIEGDNGRARYRPRRQMRLRNLLFNNPYVEQFRTKSMADADKWLAWEEMFLTSAAGVNKGDLAYLQSTFLNFNDFVKALDVLRLSAFEANSNKRWSSKFVFPFGPDALYEDIRVDAKGGASNDRRFFARTGELLYLMLCRSVNAPKLGPLLVSRLFNQAAPLNRLAKALQSDPQHAGDEGGRETGYLPHRKLPRFDRICDDWLAILSLDMSATDAIEHLVASAGLNLLLYFLERGKSAAGDSDPVEFVCEIISRDRTKVRALSGDSWQANQAVSLRAIRASIEAVRALPEWEQALGSADAGSACADVMRGMFQWPSDEKAAESTPEGLIADLLAEAESRHVQHVGRIHGAWARAVGLSSRRLSRRTRYAPNDRLLKTLVVTVVEGRMEFGEFLREIHRRYGFIIGEAEGVRLVRDNLVDQEALNDNAARLESRLLGLGLLRRLSDSCAFVENPFYRHEETI